MPRTELTIDTADGRCPASLHVPEGDGPWPGVVLFHDASGVRDTFRTMADRLAGLGYAVLLPDLYYRAGEIAPFDVRTIFDNPEERKRMGVLVVQLTGERIAADASAYVDALLARPETSGSAVGTTGYCLGGKMSLLAAGALGERVAAAASFHGAWLAADTPDSPHHRAPGIRGTVYVAAAQDDATFPPEQFTRLGDALTAADVPHTLETWPAQHGFAVPDNHTYDADAGKRHWAALEELYGTALQNA